MTPAGALVAILRPKKGLYTRRKIIRDVRAPCVKSKFKILSPNPYWRRTEKCLLKSPLR